MFQNYLKCCIWYYNLKHKACWVKFKSRSKVLTFDVDYHVFVHIYTIPNIFKSLSSPAPIYKKKKFILMRY